MLIAVSVSLKPYSGLAYAVLLEVGAGTPDVPDDHHASLRPRGPGRTDVEDSPAGPIWLIGYLRRLGFSAPRLSDPSFTDHYH
jgi:hypothetical protein